MVKSPIFYSGRSFAPLVPALRGGKRDLSVRTEAAQLDLCLFLVYYYQFPSYVSFFDLSFLAEIPIETFLTVLSLARFSSSQALAFLTPSLHNQAAFRLLYFNKIWDNSRILYLGTSGPLVQIYQVSR